MCLPAIIAGVGAGFSAMTSAGGLAAIAIAGSLASAGMSAASSIQSGKAQQRIANYNAEVKRMQAARAVEVGQFEASKSKMNSSLLLARQAAILSARGLSITGGSSASGLLDTTAAQGELDSRVIISNALAQGYGLRMGATSLRLQGSLARQAGIGNAVGSLISGVSSAADSWASYKQTKVT